MYLNQPNLYFHIFSYALTELLEILSLQLLPNIHFNIRIFDTLVLSIWLNLVTQHNIS